MENDQKERLNCALGRISSAATSATATMQEFSASMSQLSEAAADQQTNDGQQIAKPEKKRSWKNTLLLKLGLVPYSEVCKIRIEVERKHRAELRKIEDALEQTKTQLAESKETETLNWLELLEERKRTRALGALLKSMPFINAEQLRASTVGPNTIRISESLMLPKDAAEINNPQALRRWMLIQMEDKLSSLLRVTEADKQDTFFRYFEGSLTVVESADMENADGTDAGAEDAGTTGKEAAQDG